MSTSVLLETLASYIPHLVTRAVATNPTPLTTPTGERFPAAMLFADISGFTRLSERLTRRGPEGVEDLSNLLNAYFGQLIDIVLDHKGDIVEFTGDGIIALWTAHDGETLATAVLRACVCGLAIQQGMAFYAQAENLNLALRICIGAGEVLFASVGGILGRWELLVAGNLILQQVSTTVKWTEPGEVVLSSEAWDLVHSRCNGQLLAAGGARLEQVNAVLPPPPFQPPVILKPQMIAPMRGYLPGAILDRLEAGLSDWLAELRCVTALFVHVGELDYDEPDALEQAHIVMRSLQSALYRYEGSVNQFIVDDKGTIFVAALGLPPLTHEDDAVRGVQAALAMHEQLHLMGMQCAIGVATGWVFCGARGNVRRRDYAMIGDTMNLAARLMQVAAENNGNGMVAVLCDPATYEATRNRLAFEVLPPVKIKGKSSPVALYRPLGREVTTVRRRTAIVGRSAERALLFERLGLLQHSQDAGVVIIEGETGLGKSRLINDLLQQAEMLHISSLVGIGDAIERSTSYHAWRPIFAQLFQLDTLPDDQLVRRMHILERLRINPELQRLAPLINAVLPLDIPENEITEQMAGQVRADNTRRLLIRVLQMVVSLSPTVIVLDEAHWLDSVSWALLLDVARRVSPILLIIATRPLNEAVSGEYSQLLRRLDTRHIVLERLSSEQTLQLVCQNLGVASLPDQVARLILEKSEGNPLFSEELVYALRDTGVLTINNGECHLSPDAGDLRSLSFPASLQGIVISRIDRLIPSQQLVLKVASVIGHIFALRTLQAVHPIEEDRPLLPDYLQSLDRLNITALQASEPYLTYIFKHIIIHEVVYNLLLFSQRRELHRAVAEWYEQTYADDLHPYYPLLAHHWQKAEVLPRAVDYLERAGEQALRDYANQEAVNFFQQALDLVAKPPDERHEPARTGEQAAIALASPGASQLRRARWERQLGEAYLGLGQLAESRQHLERAVALLQRPVPTQRRKLTATTLRQAIRQTLHRVLTSLFREKSSAERAAILETARAYDSLLVIYYFANETLPSIYTSLLTLNLAERAGPSPELARAYANMCIATGSLALHPLAETYRRQAMATAEQIGELATQGYVLNIIGLYLVGVGNWPEARVTLEQGVDICERLGDRRRWGATWTLLAQIAYYEGDFVRSSEMFAELYSVARRSGDVLQQAWAQGGQGQSALRMGWLGEACTFLEQANVALAENAELPSQISNYGLLAMGRLRQGDQQRALQAARSAARLLSDIPVPTAYYLIEGYAGFAETYLSLWEASGGQVNRRAALAQQARQACDALAHFARTFPIGRPRSLLCRGWYTWLDNKPAQALAIWRSGLAAAERMQMPYEQGLAHGEIGRHATGYQRHYHLKCAHQIFTRLGAAEDIARIERLWH